MSEKSAAAVAVPEQATTPEQQADEQRKTKRQPPYHVILWNDDDHSYIYVIDMLQALFGHPPEKGFQLAEEVDKSGRAIVMTTTLERAELKRDQVHAFGKDRDIRACKGSMRASIEASE